MSGVRRELAGRWGALNFEAVCWLAPHFGLWLTSERNPCKVFDNAETYAYGKAETIMGEAIKMGLSENLWARSDLVVSTKIYWVGRLETGFWLCACWPKQRRLSPRLPAGERWL